MRFLIVLAAIAVVALATPHRERRSYNLGGLGLGLGHNGAVVLGGLGHGLALSGPVAPGVSVIGPVDPSVAVIGPHSGSAAVIGPQAGPAAIVGPSAGAALVAGPAGAILAPGWGGLGHGGIIAGNGLLGGHGIW